MSKLMSVLGIVMLAVGAALALVGIVNPAQMDIYGLKLDTAAILFTGGVLAVGLGGVIAALQEQGVAPLRRGVDPTAVPAPVEDQGAPMAAPAIAAAPAVVTEAPVAEEPASRVRFNPFGRKAAEAAVVAGAGAAAVFADKASEAGSATAKGVDDTIAALEQAKADIANAIGGMASVTTPAADEREDVQDDDVEGDEEGELYVVEEREIRGRPARILSDDTVEAETDEGWMRFENLEHLNEYLDSMGEPA